MHFITLWCFTWLAHTHILDFLKNTNLCIHVAHILQTLATEMLEVTEIRINGRACQNISRALKKSSDSRRLKWSIYYVKLITVSTVGEKETDQVASSLFNKTLELVCLQLSGQSQRNFLRERPNRKYIFINETQMRCLTKVLKLICTLCTVEFKYHRSSTMKYHLYK